MTKVYRVREIADEHGKGVGKYRLCCNSYGLCEHEHDTEEEATNCPIAAPIYKRAFGRDAESLKSEVEHYKRKLEHAEMELAKELADG